MRRKGIKNRGSGNNRLTNLGLGLVVIIIIGVIGFGGYYFQKDDIDPKTGCLSSGPKSVTAIILDTSDPLTVKQQGSFDKFVETLTKTPVGVSTQNLNADGRNYVAKYHLLVVYEILRSPTEQPKLLFRGCNPGDPDTRGVKETLSDPKLVSVIRWNKFKKLVKDAFPQNPTEEAPVSLILETIGTVRGREFPSVPELRGNAKTAGVLFIVSDLLQNSGRLTHFREGNLPNPTIIPNQFAIDLTGIDVGLKYLKYPKYKKYRRGNEHFAWWRRVIASANGRMRAPEVW